MNSEIPTVSEYAARIPNDMRSDIGFAVWILHVTKPVENDIPFQFRTQWKSFLAALIL